MCFYGSIQKLFHINLPDIFPNNCVAKRCRETSQQSFMILNWKIQLFESCSCFWSPNDGRESSGGGLILVSVEKPITNFPVAVQWMYDDISKGSLTNRQSTARNAIFSFRHWINRSRSRDTQALFIPSQTRGIALRNNRITKHSCSYLIVSYISDDILQSNVRRKYQICCTLVASCCNFGKSSPLI